MFISPRDILPDHERGRLRQVEAREPSVPEGLGANPRHLGGYHERALKASVIEGQRPDLQERGRVREIEAG